MRTRVPPSPLGRLIAYVRERVGQRAWDGACERAWDGARAGALVGALGVALGGTDASALPPERAQKIVDDARALLGVPYTLGGRIRSEGEGIDCQGLVFFAVQSAMPSSTRANARRTGERDACGWKSFSVMPSKSVPAHELGAPVLLGRAGEAAVSTKNLDTTKLLPGDVIHFISAIENPAEPAIGTVGGTPVWVWHMALATGGGQFISGDPWAGAVHEEDLLAYLRTHADDYAGVLVTRMDEGPKPAKCRRHAPMIAPVISRVIAPRQAP